MVYPDRYCCIYFTLSSRLSEWFLTIQGVSVKERSCFPIKWGFAPLPTTICPVSQCFRDALICTLWDNQPQNALTMPLCDQTQWAVKYPWEFLWCITVHPQPSHLQINITFRCFPQERKKLKLFQAWPALGDKHFRMFSSCRKVVA